MATAQHQQDIIALTTMMFDAPPGATYLAQLEEQIDDGQSLQEVAAGLANTPLFKSQFSGLDSDKEKIDQVLSFVGLNEQSSAYGEAFGFFQNSIANGVDPGVVLANASSFLSITEDENFARPAQTLRNKVEVGVKHTVDLGLSSDNFDELMNTFEDVTDDPQTVISAKQKFEEKVSNDDESDPEIETEPAPNPEVETVETVSEVFRIESPLTEDVTIQFGQAAIVFEKLVVPEGRLLKIDEGGFLFPLDGVEFSGGLKNSGSIDFSGSLPERIDDIYNEENSTVPDTSENPNDDSVTIDSDGLTISERLDLLNEDITDSDLYKDLNSPIDLIDGPIAFDTSDVTLAGMTSDQGTEEILIV